MDEHAKPTKPFIAKKKSTKEEVKEPVTTKTDGRKKQYIIEKVPKIEIEKLKPAKKVVINEEDNDIIIRPKTKEEINDSLRKNDGAESDVEFDGSDKVDTAKPETTKPESKQPPVKKGRKTLEPHSFNIDSKEMVPAPEYYSDYVMELPEKLKNVAEITLISHHLPIMTTITNKNNTITFETKDGKKQYSIRNGTFTLIKLVTMLTESTENKYKFEIIEQRKIKIDSETPFKIIKTDNSMCDILGINTERIKDFSGSIIGDNNIADAELALFIDDELFSKVIGSSNRCNISKKYNPVIDVMQEISIKFYDSAEADKKLIDFNEQTHKLDLIIKTA